MFFASCGISDEDELYSSPPPPESGLIISSDSKNVLQGTEILLTAKIGSSSVLAEWNIVGTNEDDKTIVDNTSNKRAVLTVGVNEAVGNLTVTAVYNGITGTSTVKVVATPHKTPPEGQEGSIKGKFGIAKETPEAVTETFDLLHEFIQAGGLENQNTNGLIALGDWIDLEGGLTVAEYENQGGILFDSNNTDVWDTVQTVGSYGANGKLNRLIVAGINSFHSGRGSKVDNNSNDLVPILNGDGDGEYTYPEVEEQPPSHVVFQFQNIPVTRRMNAENKNDGGYPASEMRKYLTPVYNDDGVKVDGTGNFLDGLIKAGVPEDVLWGPARVMATKNTGDTKTIHDLLWLPTAREFGFSGAIADETLQNQARLEYDGNYAKFIKKGSGYANEGYWLASPIKNNTVSFYAGNEDGSLLYSNTKASDDLGVAPAFCVK
jgi:hypothetical protein